jgi:hypothetical protein
MPEIIHDSKSTCCGAPLHSGYMTPIDTAPTLVCSRCGCRDVEAEKKNDEDDQTP